jgi:collagen type I/II/III/V/XI/XXIV/XXVII alpha
MALWDPSQLGSAFYAGFRVIDTAGANAGAEITQSAGKVNQWNDWSGSGNHIAQGNTGNQPPYGATAFNTSYPGLTFSGAQLLRRSITALPAGTLISVFAVGQMSNVGGDNRIVSFGVAGSTDTTGTHYIPLLRYGTLAFITSYSGGDLAAGAATYDTPAVFGTVPSGTQHTAYSNGTASSTSFTYPSTYAPSAFGIGADGSASFVSSPLTGIISEVVIVTGAISSADIDRVNGYLAWKYGLQGNLPTGHAYKSAAPTAAAAGSSGTSAGLGTATGVGASTRAAAGSSAGLGAATAPGGSIIASAGNSAGVGAANATGASGTTVSGAGTSSGVGAATATGASSAAGQGAGTSAGLSTVVATGAATKAAAGSVTGIATASGTAPIYQVISAVGSSFGGGLAFASPFVATPVIIGDGNRLLTPLVTIDHDMLRYKSGAKASVNNSSARGREAPARRPYAETWD